MKKRTIKGPVIDLRTAAKAQLRLHLVALPHVRLGAPNTHLCAYSGKVMKFCKMMSGEAEIIVYAPESNNVRGVELVNCFPDRLRQKLFGKDDPNRLPDWPTDEQAVAFNATVIVEMQKRMQPHDLILLVGGWTQKAVSDAFPNHIKCEPFCGYGGILAPFQNVPAAGPYVAFESYFHMAQVYATKGITDIRWYDRVIPPFVDPDEFIVTAPLTKQLLFLGRAIARKGPHIAYQIAQAAGLQLVVAGAGWTKKGNKLIGNGITLEGNAKQLKYVGPVDIKKRAMLMSMCRALICPTTYFEPGGNVAIEAMTAGCPVICPDSGVFAETVENGMTGIHFRTLKEAVIGVADARNMDRSVIQGIARRKYSLDAIRHQYLRWFSALQDLWGEGWNKL